MKRNLYVVSKKYAKNYISCLNDLKTIRKYIYDTSKDDHEFGLFLISKSLYNV